MDALGLSAPRLNTACSSVEDLQGQLHQLLAAKTTDTRAEHVSPSFELLPHTALHLPAEPEHGAIDGADPHLEAARSQQHSVARTVLASETVQNQPSDDPVLQKAAAKHISNAIGAVDNSTWTVRQVTRGAQGWQFTYICKASLQAWNRANGKNPDRPVIASYSGSGGLDTINLSRPAFDCRGTLTIAFSKSSRGIVVKYEHTPLHKTVTQLVERFVPTPIPVRVDHHGGSQRTPKAKRPRPIDGEGSRQKKTPKAKPLSADDKADSSKKRTPKAKRPPPAEEGTGGGSSRKRRKTGKASGADVGGLGNSGDIDTPQGQVQPAGVDKTDFTGFLNVPPAEAQRRRQTAIELLSGRGIDPATLSAEQFNIFANQAPNLQAASLDMLAKYGAERLRIVHPDEKEQAGSSNSTPATEQAANPLPGVAPEPPSANTNTPTKRVRNKRKSGEKPTEVPIGSGAVIPLEQDGGLGTTESALKPKPARVRVRIRKTRGRCDTCKQRNCTKEHPSCSVCVDAGVECIYLPPKPRRKSEKSTETVQQEDSDPPEDDDHVEHEADESRQIIVPEPQEPRTIVIPQPPPDIENEEFIPDPNILSETVEHQTGSAQPVNATNYYQNSHNGAGFPHVSSAQETAAVGTTSMPAFTYARAQTNENVTHAPPVTTFPPPPQVQSEHSDDLPTLQSITSSTPQQKTQSASTNRKSLPTGQSKQTPIPPPTIPTHASNWDSSPTMHQSMSASPNPVPQQAAKRPKSRKSRVEVEQKGHDSLKQAVSQPTKYQSPMTRSPYQSAAHVNSRHSHRSQTNTPVATSSLPPPQTSSTTTHQSTTGASYSTSTAASSIPNYDPYPQYNNNRNEQYTDAGNDHHSSRIPYDSSSYQTNTTTTAPSSYSSIPSYDYGRAAGSSNPLSQALSSTSTYSSTTGTATNQWPTSQTRGTQNSNNSSTYSLPASGTSTSHSYNTRASEPRASNQNASYHQTQSQSYNSYPPQQSSLNQQGQQNWYGFTAANSSNTQASYANNRQNAHASHRSTAPAYSSQYGGNDEQAIYDLLRTGSSNH
ncbi:hypothetical protein F5Y03DRAFT_390791 [Xylaria venustula]|nr:hypothetical protein F5Y03DRAFT_390791 [Xylaria venustula]